MSQQVTAWFREVIKDKIHINMQGRGGLLDATMETGDTEAGTVKFPIVTGVSVVYKLTGAIEMVPVSNPGLTTVTLTMDDFEASEWWRVQDAMKSGPKEQDALAKLLSKAIRRKRDTIKMAALASFYDANSGTMETVGTGAEAVDNIYFETARAKLEKEGDDGIDGEVFCPVPAMWLAQMEYFREWREATYVGPENAPFSKAMRARTKTIRGVHYIMSPDNYFRVPAAGQWETFMWRKAAMGCETTVNMENANLTQHHDRQGSPYLAKAALSSAVVGLEVAGVKRILLLQTTAITRPAL